MEIDIPDLDDVRFEDTCRFCYGSGQRDYYEQVPYVTKTSKARHRTETKRKTCEYCNGSGSKLTSVGERLLEFLKKHKGI